MVECWSSIHRALVLIPRNKEAEGARQLCVEEGGGMGQRVVSDAHWLSC